MQTDHQSQICSLFLEIVVSLEELDKKISSLQRLIFQGLRQRPECSKPLQDLLCYQKAQELTERVETLEHCVRNHIPALEERLRESESSPIDYDGDVRSYADFRDTAND